MSISVLLDTHALLWWLHQPNSLSPRAEEAIASGENAVYVSAVSAIEIAAKKRKDALEFDTPLVHDFTAITTSEGFKQLFVTSEHAQLAGNLAHPHNDPWDRILAAQSQLEQLVLLTCDAEPRTFNISTLW